MEIRGIDIAGALEAVAPLARQEDYDNCGWQVGDPDAICTGALVCLDATAERVAEAAAAGCNLIVSHHPLLFRGLKRITGDHSAVARTVISAISHGISVYSLHTALDNAPAPDSVSFEMARMMGLSDIAPLDCNSGAGAIGVLPGRVSPDEAVSLIKATFGSPVVRCSDISRWKGSGVRTVALCGGSGSFMAPMAAKRGADLFLTSDTTYHTFVDLQSDIILADIGHFESEQCTKAIITHIISEKFPNFAVHYSQQESNPITYL